MSADRRFRKSLAAALLAPAFVMAVHAFVRVDDASAQPPGTQRFVVLGCLSREAPPARGGKPAPPVYTIRDTRGEGTTYRIEGNEEELRLHVGHTVEVSGTLSPVPATATNATVRTLKMSSLTYLSTTCIYK